MLVCSSLAVVCRCHALIICVILGRLVILIELIISLTRSLARDIGFHTPTLFAFLDPCARCVFPRYHASRAESAYCYRRCRHRHRLLATIDSYAQCSLFENVRNVRAVCFSVFRQLLLRFYNVGRDILDLESKAAESSHLVNAWARLYSLQFSAAHGASI